MTRDLIIVTEINISHDNIAELMTGETLDREYRESLARSPLHMTQSRNIEWRVSENSTWNAKTLGTIRRHADFFDLFRSNKGVSESTKLLTIFIREKINLIVM